ncbi:MAG TPA: hypothetical protein VHS34_16140 [Terriglobales bacterium]|jgi:hypothetical protein|nr:hypothetical protein [Terriglobales bacterium]
MTSAATLSATAAQAWFAAGERVSYEPTAKAMFLITGHAFFARHAMAQGALKIVAGAAG